MDIFGARLRFLAPFDIRGSWNQIDLMIHNITVDGNSFIRAVAGDCEDSCRSILAAANGRRVRFRQDTCADAIFYLAHPVEADSTPGRSYPLLKISDRRNMGSTR